jgi:hypothetical protein
MAHLLAISRGLRPMDRDAFLAYVIRRLNGAR